MRVSRWLQNPGDQQLFRLFGYAGTGKTTLAKHLAADVDGQVIFAAYTGKAASVLKSRGASNASTIHSLIYLPKGKSRSRYAEIEAEVTDLQQMIAESRAEGSPTRDLEQRLEKAREQLKVEDRISREPAFDLNPDSNLCGAKLLVVDECSMVNEDMAMDIMSFRVPVLVLGDPAQLPPVKGTGFFTDAEPDIMLTEIHRQARDNPIIDLATRVREGKSLDYGTYGDSQVISRANPDVALGSDQILVGMNRTRIGTNHRIRELRGHSASPFPLAGERVVCLRNDRELGLLNGTLHTTVRDAWDGDPYLNLEIVPDDYPDTTPLLVPAHKEYFNGDPDSIGYWDQLNAQAFSYGYALTVHKSQGSAWGKVMLIDESEAFRKDRRNWLYTAITRARDKITIVRK